MSEHDKLLVVDNLNIEYRTSDGTFHAVNGISFELGYRETLGLVGETGAGKTTTALAIMQLLPERTSFITKGKILFKGENLITKKKSEMQSIRGGSISMIFQDPMACLNPLITVGDQIKEVLNIHKYADASDNSVDEQCANLFKMVGIAPERAREFPGQFTDVR